MHLCNVGGAGDIRPLVPQLEACRESNLEAAFWCSPGGVMKKGEAVCGIPRPQKFFLEALGKYFWFSEVPRI